MCFNSIGVALLTLNVGFSMQAIGRVVAIGLGTTFAIVQASCVCICYCKHIQNVRVSMTSAAHV